MNEDFVTFEQAKKLSELGFDWECTYGYYMHSWMEGPKFTLYYECVEVSESYDGTDCYPAPTLYQAQKWLREIKQIYLFVTMEDSRYYWYIDKDFQIGNSKSYEEALSIGIDKAIEILIAEKDE